MSGEAEATTSWPGHLRLKVVLPVTCAVVALTDLVRAGVVTMLAPYQERVRLVGPGRAFEVGLVDPQLLDESWAPSPDCAWVALTRVVDGHARSVVSRREIRDLVTIDTAPDELVRTIERAYRRTTAPAGSNGHHGEADGLNTREAEILSLICAGRSNKDIASELYLSPNSIKTYIRTAYRKMGVESRSQAVLWGLERGY
jgi:DNA-binding NarL/FixJ family response regulator